MRRLAFALAIAASLAVLAGITAYVVLQPAYLGPALAAAVKARTGKTLAFAQAPRLALWPDVVVTFPQFTIGDDGGPPLLAGEARVTTTLAALFARRVEVVDLTLAGPQLNLVVAADGKANWAIAEADGAPLAFAIENGSVAWRDERSGQRFEAAEISAAGVFGEGGPSLALKGALVWNRQSAGFDALLKSASRFGADGSPASIAINGPTGAFDFEGRAAITGGFGLAGQMTLDAPDLRAFLRWIGLPIGGAQGLKDVRLAAALDATAGGAVFREMKLALDGMAATGGLALALAKNGPTLEGALVFDRIALDAYAPPPAAAQWRAAPIDLGGLTGYAMKLAIDGAAAAYNGIETGPIAFDLAIENGKLEAKAKPFAALGGTLAGTLVLDGGNGAPAFALALTAEKADTALLTGWLQGPVSGTLNLAGAGASEEEMVSRLSGKAALSIANGALQGVDVASLLQRASIALAEGWAAADGAATSFTNLSAKFLITDGIATTADGLLDSAGMRVPVAGDVDLLRRALDLKAAPALAGGAGLPVPVIIRGPWGAPKIYPGMPGILEDQESAYRALKKLGLPGAQ